MLGQIWNLNLHRKNLARTINAGRYPVEKHRPVCFGSFRPRGNRNIIIEDRFELDADAVGLTAPSDRLAHGESLRNLVERQIHLATDRLYTICWVAVLAQLVEVPRPWNVGLPRYLPPM
jgi:hypothetical protein